MDVIMPQLGETVAEGVVTKWYKKVGDTVKSDDTLFDVETDKVSTEIPSPVAGVIDEILIGEGVTAKVGVTLAVIRESGAAPAPQPAAVAAALDRLRSAARTTEPLMPILLDAVRAYATLGEMCDALREIWGEHVETPVI